MNLYSYARRRLFGQGEQLRSSFLNVLTLRLLKSVARSTGARIHTNKWVRLIDQLAVAYPYDRSSILLQELGNEVRSHSRTHPKTVVRIAFLIDYILHYRCTEGSNIDGVLFNRHQSAFETQIDMNWLQEVAAKHNMYIADCGHWTGRHERWTLSGDAENWESRETCCQSCVDSLVRDEMYVVDPEGSRIAYHAANAVSYLSYNQSTRLGDLRNPAILFDERRQIYHDNQWSPYSGLIENYHSSKAKGFKLIDSPWFRSHRRAFGCELEVQVRSGNKDQACGKVHDILNPSGKTGEYCYFERDGSIGDGFEIVTQPAGLDVHLAKFSAFLNNDEAKRGLRSHEGGACGFHVHVGREYLTQTQIYRVQSFLNDVRNESLIRAIARRYQSGGGGYAKFKPELAKFSVNGKNNGDRYEALNVTGDHTVEFRIFRGSLRYESIAAALEFVNAVLSFCQPGVTPFNEFNAIGFKKFVMTPEMKDDTQFLRSYLSLNSDTDNERKAA